MITKKNFQAYLLDKAEGILSDKGQEELDNFFKLNPELKPEEDEYDSNYKLFTESYICYPNQEELLHNKRKAVSFIIRYSSIAASVALIITITILFINTNNKDKFSNKIAQTTTNRIKKQIENKSLPLKIYKPIVSKKTLIFQSSDFYLPQGKGVANNTQEASSISLITRNIKEAPIDTLNIISNNLIVYIDKIGNEKKIDTIYIYTNQLCSYEKTLPNNPILMLKYSIKELFAKK